MTHTAIPLSPGGETDAARGYDAVDRVPHELFIAGEWTPSAPAYCGVRGQQQGTDLFELVCCGIDCVGIAVGNRGGVSGRYGRQPSAGFVGDLNEAGQT